MDVPIGGDSTTATSLHRHATVHPGQIVRQGGTVWRSLQPIPRDLHQRTGFEATWRSGDGVSVAVVLCGTRRPILARISAQRKRWVPDDASERVTSSPRLAEPIG